MRSCTHLSRSVPAPAIRKHLGPDQSILVYQLRLWAGTDIATRFICSIVISPLNVFVFPLLTGHPGPTPILGDRSSESSSYSAYCCAQQLSDCRKGAFRPPLTRFQCIFSQTTHFDGPTPDIRSSFFCQETCVC